MRLWLGGVFLAPIIESIRRNKKIVREIAKTLSPKRFKHTIQVALLAGELAKTYQQDEKDIDRVIKAALIHDYAREKSNEELLRLAEKSGWRVDSVERKQPMLLHGPVAAFLARQEWDISDPIILEAIAYHTTGRPEMTATAKLLYIADMAEPGRSYPGVEELRKLAFKDLEKSLLACLDHTIKYLIDKNAPIHLSSIRTRNELINENDKRRGY